MFGSWGAQPLRIRGALAAAAVVLLAGCAREERSPGPVSLSSERSLRPPAHVAAMPAGGLIALVAEGPAGTPAFYRAVLPARQWRRWGPLTDLPAGTATALAAGADFAVAAAWSGESLWVASAGWDANRSAALRASLARLAADSTILALDLAAATTSTAEGGPARLHLACLRASPAAGGRAIEYRQSRDRGLTWSDPVLVAEGTLGPPAIGASPDRGETLDLVYARDGRLCWRGSIHGGRQWIEEKEIRLRVLGDVTPDIARNGDDVLVVGESPRHQLVCCASRNGGHNWERAIALARDSRERRLPVADGRAGLFWVAFAEGDSLVMARATRSPWLPDRWRPSEPVGRCAGPGRAALVALPDSCAGVLFAAPDEQVRFALVR